MLVKTTSNPTLDDVISVADLKTFCRVDGTAEDTLVSNFRDAAISYIESACNIRIGDVTAEGYLDQFEPTSFPFGPVSAISSVEYLNQSNVLTTLPASKYYFEIDGSAGRMNFLNYPTVYSYALNRVKINFTVGYPEAEVPQGILQAIRILVAHYYENRQPSVVGKTVNAVPYSVDALLNNFRVL
tara:strand:- start:3941 stop:4495 length:555 start_codon:yes stop_codon:yes gene_type:complete